MSKYYSNKSDFSEAGSNLQSISGGDTSNSNNSYNYNNYISGGYPSSGSTSDSYNYNSYNNYMSGGYPSGVSSKSMSQLINDIEEVANTVTSEGVADLYVQTGEAALNVTKDSDEFDKATTRVSKILKSARKIHQNIMQNVDSKFTLGIDKVLEGLNKINGSNSKYKTKNLTKTEHNYRPVNGNICAPTAYYDDKKEVPYSLSEILDGKASPIKAAKDVYSKRLEAVKELLKHKDKMTDQQIKEIRGKSAEKILELWYPKEIPDYQKLKASRFQEEHRETLHMVDFALKTFASFAALGGIIFSLPTGGSSLGVTFAATAYIATDKAYSAFSGRTMITGDRLSTEERVWAGIDAVSSILSERAGFYLMKLQKAGKTGSTLLKLTSHADDANDISKVAYAYATDKDPKDAVGNLVVGQVKGFVAKKAGSLLHSKFGKTNAPDVPDVPTDSTKQHIEVDSSGLNSKKLKIDPTVVHQKKNPKLDLKIEPTVKADLASTPKPHVDVETSKIKPVEAVAGAATVVPKSKTPDIDVLTKPKDLSTIKGEAVDHVGTVKPKVDSDVPEVKNVQDVEAPKYNREQIIRNIEESKLARESSNFDQYLAKEKFQKTLIDMDPMDRPRYLQWHDYAESGLTVQERVKLLSWDRPVNSKLYLKNKAVYDNPKYFDQLTGNENWPGQKGDPNIDGFVKGEYQKTTLSPGDKIDRFGSDYGQFFGNIGESKEMRAMSPNSDFKNHSQYEILMDLPVLKGKIAPWFDQPGGGIQFKLDPSFVEQIKAIPSDETAIIKKLIELGYLRKL